MNFYRNTDSDLLWDTLLKLMSSEELSSFRLVGGTSLSIQLGHRKSVDIDMFTDSEYGTIDFDIIDKLMLNSFKYAEMDNNNIHSIGKTYYVGDNNEEKIKVDLFYTDPFIFPILNFEGIRLAKMEEIIAMKLEVIGHAGRKKDFWDLHELLDYFTLPQMLSFYTKRYPYSYTENEIIEKLVDFSEADSDFDPICLKNKYWELIKIDIEETLTKTFSSSTPHTPHN